MRWEPGFQLRRSSAHTAALMCQALDRDWTQMRKTQVRTLRSVLSGERVVDTVSSRMMCVVWTVEARGCAGAGQWAVQLSGEASQIVSL